MLLTFTSDLVCGDICCDCRVVAVEAGNALSAVETPLIGDDIAVVDALDIFEAFDEIIPMLWHNFLKPFLRKLPALTSCINLGTNTIYQLKLTKNI